MKHSMIIKVVAVLVTCLLIGLSLLLSLRMDLRSAIAEVTLAGTSEESKVLEPLDVLEMKALLQSVREERSALETFRDEYNFDKKGYQIKKGDVKFKFLNPLNQHGSQKKITKANHEVYLEYVRDQEVFEPKDYDVSTLRPSLNPETYEHALATVFALVRNSELDDIVKTIKKFENTFNKKFRYPYTFANDEEFTEEFKKTVRGLSEAKMEFVLIPKELWDRPSSIDEAKMEEAMQKMADKRIPYSKLASYRNMCRFNLVNFYKLPELQKYKWYWRIEPDVEFYSHLNYDVFKYLEKTGKIYGFTMSIYDIEETIETLWTDTLSWLNEGDNYKFVNENGPFQWLTNNLQHPGKAKVTKGYSTCHFWSNFEIADMDFYRGEAYSKWADFLESTGKFYYERWGDAPVHSLGVALFADKEKIHWFRDIGYRHDMYGYCPNRKDREPCEAGHFSSEQMNTENCMASWIEYEYDAPNLLY